MGDLIDQLAKYLPNGIAANTRLGITIMAFSCKANKSDNAKLGKTLCSILEKCRELKFVSNGIHKSFSAFITAYLARENIANSHNLPETYYQMIDISSDYSNIVMQDGNAPSLPDRDTNSLYNISILLNEASVKQLSNVPRHQYSAIAKTTTAKPKKPAPKEVLYAKEWSRLTKFGFADSDMLKIMRANASKHCDGSTTLKYLAAECEKLPTVNGWNKNDLIDCMTCRGSGTKNLEVILKHAQELNNAQIPFHETVKVLRTLSTINGVKPRITRLREAVKLNEMHTFMELYGGTFVYTPKAWDVIRAVLTDRYLAENKSSGSGSGRKSNKRTRGGGTGNETENRDDSLHDEPQTTAAKQRKLFFSQQVIASSSAAQDVTTHLNQAYNLTTSVVSADGDFLTRKFWG